MICTKRLKILFLDLELSNLLLNNELKSIKRFGINKIGNWLEEARKDEINYYIEKLKEDEKILPMAIVIRRIDRRIIGDIQLNYDESSHSVDIGYEIVKSYRKKGYAYEAVREIIEYLKNNFNNLNITAKCFIDNKPSVKLLNKLNMTEVKKDCALIYFRLNNMS